MNAVDQSFWDGCVVCLKSKCWQWVIRSVSAKDWSSSIQLEKLMHKRWANLDPHFKIPEKGSVKMCQYRAT